MDVGKNGRRNSGPPPEPPGASASPSRVCYLSRSRGWIDPENPHRPTSEVNVLAVALGTRVWTLGTAWESLFHRLIPVPIARAYRMAMVRARLTDPEVRLLKEVAEELHVRLEVVD